MIVENAQAIPSAENLRAVLTAVAGRQGMNKEGDVELLMLNQVSCYEVPLWPLGLIAFSNGLIAWA